MCGWLATVVACLFLLTSAIKTPTRRNCVMTMMFATCGTSSTVSVTWHILQSAIFKQVKFFGPSYDLLKWMLTWRPSLWCVGRLINQVWQCWPRSCLQKIRHVWVPQSLSTCPSTELNWTCCEQNGCPYERWILSHWSVWTLKLFNSAICCTVF